MSEYPEYVSDLGHGEVCSQPPGLIQNATTFCFAFECAAAAVQKTVDKFLNAPSAGAVEYSVLGSTIFVTFLHAERLSSEAQVIGYIPDGECAFWVPLLGRSREGSAPDRIVYWNPYLVIDNAEGMVTGREVWGFRKFMGTVTSPQPGDPVARFTATARIYPHFGANTPGTFEQLVLIEKSGPLGILQETWHEAEAAFQAIIGLWTGGAGHLPVHGWSATIHLLNQLRHHQVPMVNLKQFRDAQDPTRACYQAIIESTCTLKKLLGVGMLTGEFTLDITPNDTYQITSDLGLSAKPKSRFACWTRMDFTADLGVEVWKAGATAEGVARGALRKA